MTNKEPKMDENGNNPKAKRGRISPPTSIKSYTNKIGNGNTTQIISPEYIKHIKKDNTLKDKFITQVRTLIIGAIGSRNRDIIMDSKTLITIQLPHKKEHSVYKGYFKEIYKALGEILFGDSEKIEDVHQAILFNNKTRQTYNQKEQESKTNDNLQKTEKIDPPLNKSIHEDKSTKENTIGSFSRETALRKMQELFGDRLNRIKSSIANKHQEDISSIIDIIAFHKVLEDIEMGIKTSILNKDLKKQQKIEHEVHKYIKILVNYTHDKTIEYFHKGRSQKTLTEIYNIIKSES